MLPSSAALADVMVSCRIFNLSNYAIELARKRLLAYAHYAAASDDRSESRSHPVTAQCIPESGI